MPSKELLAATAVSAGCSSLSSCLHIFNPFPSPTRRETHGEICGVHSILVPQRFRALLLTRLVLLVLLMFSILPPSPEQGLRSPLTALDLPLGPSHINLPLCTLFLSSNSSSYIPTVSPDIKFKSPCIARAIRAPRCGVTTMMQTNQSSPLASP